MIGALLRFFSYLYHVALSILLVGVSLVALFSKSHTLRLGMFPWTGKTLTYWLLGAGLGGLLSVLLAMTGKFRLLFVLYAPAVFWMLLRGYFLGSYSFSGKDEFRMACWLTGGALVAAIGAWSWPRKNKRKRR